MMKNDKNQLWKLRHSAEHVLHQAVKELYPDIQLAMGPATEEGFYCDFDNKPEGKEPIHISEENFPKIEKRMKKIVQRDMQIIRHEIDEEQARELFKDNPYKQEWIDEAVKKKDKITVYWTGKPNEKGSMVDLCAGPHIDSTGKVKHFKLLSMAGAYWRGDENNKMLTRIYGTAFETKEELEEYITLQEELKKRDHRKLGKELDLFVFSELVGQGLPLWTPRGTLIRNLLDDFVWDLRQKKGYKKVEIPHITKKDLYEVSGHWDKFSDELFHIKTREGHDFVMKPMNCPHHTQIYASRKRSYRDLPHRYANTTMVYRDEQSGELMGLSRVRSITQDDAHVFCRMSQAKQEFLKIWDIIDEFYGAFGFDLTVRLSLHDPDNLGNYLGTKEEWGKTENILRETAKERGVKVEEVPGEAAFYGPKIDFMAQDSLKRQWQVATIQLDTNMPERFDLSCINEQGEEERVVMIHAAIMGAIERFMSILIEHYAGSFPLWLSPVQVTLIPIAERHSKHAKTIAKDLQQAGLRVEVDERNERMQAKIRDATLQKTPYIGIIGDREIEQASIAVRNREGKDLGAVPIKTFIKDLNLQIEKKA